MNQLLTRERYADLPTERVPAIMPATLYGPAVQEARAIMFPHETPDHLFLRLLLFYQHAQRQDSDTALLAAMEAAQ